MKQFMFASALALSLGVTAQGANYYVDATAAKGGDGSAKAPYPTIQQAADMAQAGDTVFIKPGTYTESVKPKNSGKEGSPITFRNCPGEEKPLIIGGDRVTGPWTLEGNGIYWAPCTWGMKVPGQNQVVVDGDLMIEARWPNIAGKEQLAPARRLFNEGGGQGLLAVMQFNKDDVVVTNSPKWGTDFWKGGVVWGVGGWSARSALITGSQTSGDACRMTVSTNKTDWWNNFAGGAAPGFLTGAKGALDCEKEFFLDEAAGRLYLMAPGAVDPSGLAVYAKKRVTVIDMSGLTNVVFTQINTMIGGITLNHATRCALQNGRHLYSNHFYLMPSGRGDAVLGTTRDDPAGAAVYVSGESNRIEGCEIAYSATGLRLDGRNHVVRNCVITDNYIGSYFSGIFIGDFYPVGGECGGHLIERNTISRTGRGAVYWNEHKNAEPIKSTYTKCRVLYNHISDFMENTEDGGAVYAWCVWANGTEVAYNWVHGDHGNYHFNPALYADDVTADFRYHHNVIWDVKLGIGWNKPRGGHEAYNNTIWGRNSSVTLTVNAGGCKVYNNLSNRDFKDTSNSEVKNNLTSGGFVGNPDKPASGLDFRLASNSPAINAGVVIPGVTDGAIGAPDVGAYEFGGPAWIPGAGTEPVAPTAPADFSATAASSHLIQLGWTDLAQNETTYTVERSTDGKIWTLLATLPADAFSYADAGFHLKAGTAYQYRVAASNDYGRSAYVNASAATPVADKAPVIINEAPPQAKGHVGPPLVGAPRPSTSEGPTGWEGIAFTYTITAANDPAEVTVEGLPKGLTFNPVSGVIAGYPEAAGEAKIKITATNAKGTDTKTLALTIGKPTPLQVTGGAISEYADAAGVRWTVFTFTNNGSFTVAGGPVEYLVVAGGGGGSIHNEGGGAGGAGGLLSGTMTLARGTYAVHVGAGGAGSTAAGEGVGARGEDSYVTNTAGGRFLLRAYGGGAGASWGNAGDGGSGGGGGVNSSGSAGRGWSGYCVGTQWVPRQGYAGGRDSGSGGGADGPGADRINGGIQEGGPGRSSNLRNGTAVTYATGGKSRRTQGSGDDGPPNTGNGGGSGDRAGGSGFRAGNGGSGIVIVRFVRTGM